MKMRMEARAALAACKPVPDFLHVTADFIPGYTDYEFVEAAA